MSTLWRGGSPGGSLRRGHSALKKRAAFLRPDSISSGAWKNPAEAEGRIQSPRPAAAVMNPVPPPERTVRRTGSRLKCHAPREPSPPRRREQPAIGFGLSGMVQPWVTDRGQRLPAHHPRACPRPESRPRGSPVTVRGMRRRRCPRSAAPTCRPQSPKPEGQSPTRAALQGPFSLTTVGDSRLARLDTRRAVEGRAAAALLP